MINFFSVVGTKAWCNGGRSDRALVGRCIRRERGFGGSFSEALDRQGADHLYIMTSRDGKVARLAFVLE